MSLPIVTSPIYTAQLKSIKQPVRYRPYTVKEEKIFLIAKEATDAKDMETAVAQIIRNCTFNEIDVDKLPSFDIEYLFLQLRAKSVNNLVELQYQCENVITSTLDDGTTSQKKCHAPVKVVIPVDEIAIITPENHTNIVKITDELTIEFQYPTIKLIGELLSKRTSDPTLSTDIIAATIKSIVESDGTVHEARDYTKVELEEFIDALTLQQVDACQVFFSSMPSLKYETTFICSKCGYTEQLVFQGLADFFD